MIDCTDKFQLKRAKYHDFKRGKNNCEFPACSRRWVVSVSGHVMGQSNQLG